MTTPLHALIATIAVLSATAAHAQSSAAARPLDKDELAALSPTRKTLEQGRAIAEAACARCHGMDGISESPDHPHIAGQRTVYLYRVIEAYQTGARLDESMGHASGFLNDEGMRSVAAYYASLPPAQPTPPADPATPVGILGDDPFADLRAGLKKCVKCHEETGNSDAAGMPNLTAQSPEYFKTSMLAYADGSRSHKMMKKLTGALDDETIEAMGVYYAVQEPQRSATRGEGNEVAGRKLAEDCATCHGDDGNADDEKMPSLAGQDAKYFVKAMNAYKRGQREHEKMFEAVEELSDQDIADLATFYAGREPRRRDVRTPLAASQWVHRCERCHGLDGNSTDPRFPMLAGQNPGYLKVALTAYASESRDSRTMHAMAEPLKRSDIDSLVNYFAAQQPKAVVYMKLPCAEAEEAE